MIPKELIQQWEKEAEEHASIGHKKWSLGHNSSMNNYIAGRRAQYLQMQAEIERLKGLVEAAYRGMMTEFFESRDNDTDILTLVDENWQRYKQHHNL